MEQEQILVGRFRGGKKSTCKFLGCSLGIPYWNKENSTGGMNPAWSRCRFWGQTHPFPGRILWAAPGTGTSPSQGTAQPQTIPGRIGSLVLPRFVGWFVGSLNPPFPQGFPQAELLAALMDFPALLARSPRRGPSHPLLAPSAIPEANPWPGTPCLALKGIQALGTAGTNSPVPSKGCFLPGKGRIGVNPSSFCSAGALILRTAPFPKFPK